MSVPVISCVCCCSEAAVRCPRVGLAFAQTLTADCGLRLGLNLGQCRRLRIVVIHGGLVTVVIHDKGGCNIGQQHQAEPPAYAQCPRLSFAFAFVVPVAMCIDNAGYEHGC